MTDITDEEREVAAQVLAEAIFGAPRIDLMAALIPGVDALVAWGWRPAPTPSADNTELIAEAEQRAGYLRSLPESGGSNNSVSANLIERLVAALQSPARPGFEPEPTSDDEAWNAHLKEQGIELSGLTPLKVHQLLAYQHSFLAGRRSAVIAQPDRETLAQAMHDAVYPHLASKLAAGSIWFARADAVIAALSAPTPRTEESQVITLCGSSKFKDDINAENARLTRDGNVVISLGMFGHADFPEYDWSTDISDLKRRLDRLHFQKIRMADRVHVVNPGGYVGESTAREVRYAESLGKPVTYMVALSAPTKEGANQ